MLYAFSKVLMSIVLRGYVRKIESYGLDIVPARGPLIISSNHPNALLDAVILAVMLKRKLHFLSRADVFNTPFKRWFFALLGIIPVYRIRDGRENLDKNKEIFARCYQILAQGGTILIFSEGSCVVEKHLRTLKPGTAQLATGFYRQYERAVPVTCIGLTYSDPLYFRTKVKLSCSEPINAAGPDDRKNVMELTWLIRKKLLENMVHVDKGNGEDMYEPVERSEELRRYRLGWHIRLPVRPPEYKLIEQLQKESGNPADYVVAGKKTPVIKYVFLVLCFPLFIAGYVFNLPVKMLVLALVRSRVKEEQFTASVKLVGGTVIWVTYCFIWACIFVITQVHLYVLAVLVTCSCLAVRWYEAYKSTYKSTNEQSL